MYVRAVGPHTRFASFRFLLEFIRFFRPTRAQFAHDSCESRRKQSISIAVSHRCVWCGLLFYCRQTSKRHFEAEDGRSRRKNKTIIVCAHSHAHGAMDSPVQEVS